MNPVIRASLAALAFALMLTILGAVIAAIDYTLYAHGGIHPTTATLLITACVIVLYCIYRITHTD